MAGAMLIQGSQPGPQVMTNNPIMFWGLIASMLVGNIMLVVINLPLIGLWVSLLKVTYRLFFPAVIVFSCIGAYSRAEEHTSELQSLMRISYAVFCLTKKYSKRNKLHMSTNQNIL